ncbi:hypothetical protein F4776DRAFT_230241 [Hypoxylon sp. NC0597]|nr:hypothetical protein F4776DRAFT_230241 [Hypoxylon sp. NC0597]
MKTLSILSVLLASSALATAEGLISFFQEYNCRGLSIAQVYDPPASGDGDCIEHHYRSAIANYTDPGYIFTVYLDVECWGRKLPLRPGFCHNERFTTFSYDRGS